MIWTCLALDDRTELFYSFSSKDEAIFIDEAIDEISDDLALNTLPGKPGRIEGTRETGITDNITLIYDNTDRQIRILRILFPEALLK